MVIGHMWYAYIKKFQVIDVYLNWNLITWDILHQLWVTLYWSVENSHDPDEQHQVCHLAFPELPESQDQPQTQPASS